MTSASVLALWVSCRSPGRRQRGKGQFTFLRGTVGRLLALTRCDGIDGLIDGLIENPADCPFDAAVDLPPCTEESDENERRSQCFLPAEMEAIQRVYDGPHNSAGPIYPGYAPGNENADYAWGPWIVDDPGLPANGAPNDQYAFALDTLRYMAFSDPTYQLQQFDFENGVDRLAALAEILDAGNPDLSAFKARGGKLLLFHTCA